MNASAIAQAVNGRLEGGSDPDLTGAAPLDHATASDLTLLSSARYVPEAQTTNGGAVLVTEDLASQVPVALTRIVVADVHRALAILLPLIYPQSGPGPGIHPTAVVEPGVSLGRDITIGAGAVIGTGTRIGDRAVVGAHGVIGRLCRIDDDVYLHPHVTLYDGVVVGARTILHSGVRAGIDGFGYSFSATGHTKVPQVGRCEVGSDVEVGANTCIDRGSIGATVIGNGCKIDNLVHIAHNVSLGEHCIVTAQVGIAGSARVGRFVTFGGQVGIPGHVNIGDGATIAAQAGVFGDVPPGETYSGYPARPHRESLRAQAALFRLPEIVKRLREIERALTDRGGEKGQ